MEFLSRSVRESLRYRATPLDPAERRQLDLLRLVTEPPPAPANPALRAELAAIAASLDRALREGEVVRQGRQGALPRPRGARGTSWPRAATRTSCSTPGRAGTPSPGPMRPLYERMVELGNKGAKEIGFADLGELWRAGYDMPPEAFEADTERLWQRGEAALRRAPLLRARASCRRATARTRCRTAAHPRAPARQHVGAGVGATSTRSSSRTRAWARSTSTRAARRQKCDAEKMVKLGEGFFTSLGLDAAAGDLLGALAVHQAARPRGRLPRQRLGRDLRQRPAHQDVHQAQRGGPHHHPPRARARLLLHATTSCRCSFSTGANDGFHEAIGDALALSHHARLPEEARPARRRRPKDEKGAHQRPDEERAREGRLPAVRHAHRPVALGRVLRQDRSRTDYNEAWWELRAQVPGRRAAGAAQRGRLRPGREVPRPRERALHPLLPRAHPPVPVPPRAVQGAPAQTGPLHECSIYGNKAAGEKLQGDARARGLRAPGPRRSRPSPASGAWTPSAILEYFAPLRRWLAEQNRGRACGW